MKKKLEIHYSEEIKDDFEEIYKTVLISRYGKNFQENEIYETFENELYHLRDVLQQLLSILKICSKKILSHLSHFFLYGFLSSQ